MSNGPNGMNRLSRVLNVCGGRKIVLCRFISMIQLRTLDTFTAICDMLRASLMADDFGLLRHVALSNSWDASTSLILGIVQRIRQRPATGFLLATDHALDGSTKLHLQKFLILV